MNYVIFFHSLPYTEAVLMEAQRLSSIAPFTVPHYALKDTFIQGYFIPKVITIKNTIVQLLLILFYFLQGSIVQLNLHSVLNDKNTWNDVDQFRPERHLNADGKITKNEHYYPFGLGNYTFKVNLSFIILFR